MWAACLLSMIALGQAMSPAESERVRLDFPDSVELKALVDYVSATTGRNILYDESVGTLKVSLRAPEPVPKSALRGLLQTVLRSKGLALVDAERAGWLKIIKAEQLASEIAGLRTAPIDTQVEDSQPVSIILELKHADVAKINTTIAPCLTKPGGSVLAISESRIIVVTDYARNVRRICELVRLMDVAGPATEIATIALVHQTAADVASLAVRLLSDQTRGDPKAARATQLRLEPDPLGRGILAIGLREEIERAREVIAQLDVPVQRRVQLYQPKYMAASRMRTLVEQLLGTAATKVISDEASNTLVVTAGEAEHRRIAELMRQFDAAPPELARPMRFYKLLNRRADDVFATLGGLLGVPVFAGEGLATTPAGSTPQPGGSGALLPVPGPNRPPSGPGVVQVPPRPPAEQGYGESGAQRGIVSAIHGENFSLALDEHTNSLIVVAPPELHAQVEELIRRLDKRRPQVLVEVTLVSISVDDSLNLGVELQALDLGDPWDYLLFTSFGLSSIDPVTGARRLNPTAGGSGVLIAPDEIPIIFNALATKGNTKVYSAPRILVDDNATGSIESVAESPFTSVNASQTVATTSFAGFAKAGTQLSIQPHIAEGDHLELDYTLTVSSFTGSGSAAAPPPRSSDAITSTIRVPDSHTVVVGGLLTETVADSTSQVPLLGEVPVLGLLFGNNTKSKSKVRLYAFIRPTVLRDERFEDLKYLSHRALEEAELDDGYPPTRHQYMDCTQ